MNRLSCLLLVFLALAATRTAEADPILLSDNFESENGGVGWAGSYTGFANWDVTAGTVDLAGYGSWAFIPGIGGVYDDGGGGEPSPLENPEGSLFAAPLLLCQRGLDVVRTQVVHVAAGQGGQCVPHDTVETAVAQLDQVECRSGDRPRG